RRGLIAVGPFVLLVRAVGELIARIVAARRIGIAVQIVAIAIARLRVRRRPSLFHVGVGDEQEGLPPERVVRVGLEDVAQVLAALLVLLLLDQRLALLEELLLRRREKLLGDLVGLLGRRALARTAGGQDGEQRGRERDPGGAQSPMPCLSEYRQTRI